MQETIADLEKENQLLREKVELLGKIKELEEALKLSELRMPLPIYVPIPYYPQPQPYYVQPQITWTATNERISSGNTYHQ